MRILFAAAEVDPFAKVGGLADVAASLPARLLEVGHDVRVVAPCHSSALSAFRGSKKRRIIDVSVPGPQRSVEVEGGVPVDLLLDDHYFGRPNVYGEPDDLLRYQFFCRAIVALISSGPWVPDVLHLNDWHTAPLAFALRNLAWGNPVLRGLAS